MTSDGDLGGALALLVDVSTLGWAELQRQAPAARTPLSAAAYVQQILAFVNAYFLQSDGGQLLVWAVGDGASQLLWATPAVSAVLGSPLHGQPPAVVAAAGEQPTASGVALRPPVQHATNQKQAPAALILAGLKALVAQQAAANDRGEGEGPSSDMAAASDLRTDGLGAPAARDAAWAAAVCRALCALRKAGCVAADEAAYAARRASRREVVRSRVLCIKTSPDAPRQYLASMNAAFSAQRCGVIIDACVVGSTPSPFLQQAAHLTGGQYAFPPQPVALLQHLLAASVAGVCERDLLAPPPVPPVDLRASCFCHRHPVDVGYACSVCLSVFCERAPSCATCGTAFQTRCAVPKRPAAVPAT